MQVIHQHWGPTCDNEACGACIPPGPGRTFESSLHWRSAPFTLACGRRMRPLNAPKFDKDGRPIRYPTIGVTFDIELVSCAACREALGVGPWGGRLIPRRWSDDRASDRKPKENQSMSDRDVWSVFGQPGFYWVRPPVGIHAVSGEPAWTVAQVMLDGEVYIIGQEERISYSRRDGDRLVPTIGANVEVGALLHDPDDPTGPRIESPGAPPAPAACSICRAVVDAFGDAHIPGEPLTETARRVTEERNRYGDRLAEINTRDWIEGQEAGASSTTPGDPRWTCGCGLSVQQPTGHRPGCSRTPIEPLWPLHGIAEEPRAVNPALPIRPRTPAHGEESAPATMPDEYKIKLGRPGSGLSPGAAVMVRSCRYTHSKQIIDFGSVDEVRAVALAMLAWAEQQNRDRLGRLDRETLAALPVGWATAPDGSIRHRSGNAKAYRRADDQPGEWRWRWTTQTPGAFTGGDAETVAHAIEQAEKLMADAPAEPEKAGGG